MSRPAAGATGEEPPIGRARSNFPDSAAVSLAAVSFPPGASVVTEEDSDGELMQVLHLPKRLERKLQDCDRCRAEVVAELTKLSPLPKGKRRGRSAGTVEPCTSISTA